MEHDQAGRVMDAIREAHCTNGERYESNGMIESIPVEPWSHMAHKLSFISSGSMIEVPEAQIGAAHLVE